jgi:DNA-binding HxlR family transcriptional regulator
MIYNRAMYRKTFTGMDCSIARALDQVGEWWSLLIVRECTLGTSRFDEFQRHLGIARNVLTNRLNHLCENGILEKVPVGESERFFQYRLTPKGDELYPVLVALLQWGDRWAGPKEGGSIKLLDDKTGKPVDWMGPRAGNGPVLDFRQIRLAPGTGAGDGTRNTVANRNRIVLGLEAPAADPSVTKSEAKPRARSRTGASPKKTLTRRASA